MSREVYVSVDVEADGPIPGPNSMLSFGAAAYTDHGDLIRTFERNLKLLDTAESHPETKAFWTKNKEAYDATRVDPVTPKDAMTDFCIWLGGLPGKSVVVGYPVTYDFTFLYWYVMRFVGKSPFGFSGLDIKTLAMVALKSTFRDATKRNMPKEWFSDKLYTHVAIDDALEQGDLFFAIREQLGIGK